MFIVPKVNRDGTKVNYYDKYAYFLIRDTYPIPILANNYISFVDLTPLKACHIKREKQNKVFLGITTKVKSTTGWFFGFKLHIVINDKGEILFVILMAMQITVNRLYI